ncbi:pentatricopeptide repeat-containing protein [Tanacetum coccineum]
MSQEMRPNVAGPAAAKSLRGKRVYGLVRWTGARRHKEWRQWEGCGGSQIGEPVFSTSWYTQQLQNLLPAMLAQVSNQGNVGNQNGNVVNENIQENVGNGGAIVLTRWIEKMEFVHDMIGCSIDQKVKYTAGSFVGKDLTHEMQKLESELWNHVIVGAGHVAYTDRYVYGLAPQIRGMVAATEPKTIQKAVQISGALIDEAVINGSIKKVEKRENVGEPSKDKNGRDDNKRTRTGNAFATTVNPIGRENTGTWPKCTICNSYHAPGGPCRTCFNCNRTGHLAKDCRGVPRNVNPVNARNPTVKACYECGSTDHVGNQDNRARGRAFMLGAEETRQDPNIMTGTFTLNNHFATTLFDSGADYGFVSTTFIPLLGLEPSKLGACVFTDRWRLDELAYGIPSDGPYQTNPPSIEDIISSIRIDREGQVRRIRHEEEIDVHDYQILTREIIPTLKPLEEIIWENIFCLGGNRDHVPACLCFMLYCAVHSERFNLAYYMAKRMKWVTKQARLILPYGMLLTRLFKFIMNEYPELYNESYVLYDRVMNPLAAQLERKPRRDRGTRRGRHSTSSSSAFDQPSSSHLNDDDDDGNDKGTSHASTPSPIRYVNSLTNQVPQVFQNPPNVDQNMEPFYTRQTEILNRQVQLRDEQRGGVRSIGKSLRRLWRNMRK